MRDSNQLTIDRIFSNVTRAEMLMWVLSIAAMVLLLTVGDESTYMEFIANDDTAYRDKQYNSYLYHHLMTLVFLGLPLLLARPLGIADIGFDLFKLGDWKWGLKWALIACVGMILPTWISSYDAQFLNEYPLAHSMFDNAGWLVLFALSYVLYYIGWEGFFRGFMGFGFIKVGYRPFVALMIQVSLSCIIHIGKPDMELTGSIAGGIIFGVLAYRSGSLLWPFLFHLFLGLLNTWLCWIHQPFNL